MKRNLAIAVLLVVAVFCSAQIVNAAEPPEAPSSAPIQFGNHHAAPGFTANFPTGSEVKYAAQKVDNQSLGLLTLHMWMAGLNNDSMGFFISYSDAPRRLQDSAVALDHVVDGAVANMGIENLQISQRVDATLSGLPARAAYVTGTINGQPFSGYWRVSVVSGTRLWQVFAMGAGNRLLTAEEAKAFFDGLKFVD